MPTVATGQIGAHALTLVANVVTEVDFADDLDLVEVVTDGAAPLYVTVDHSTPTVGGANCYMLPALPSAKEINPPSVLGTVVKLISAGTPTVSVARAHWPNSV